MTTMMVMAAVVTVVTVATAVAIMMIWKTNALSPDLL